MAVFFNYALILLVLLFWVRRTRYLLRLIHDVDKIKKWPSSKANIEWIHMSGSASSGKLRFLRSLIAKIFGSERFYMLAKFKLNDVQVGADRFSLFKKMKASHRMFIRRIQRSGQSELDVFYNPENPTESVILPPGDHHLKMDIIKHVTLTILLHLSIVILVAK